MKKLNKLLLTIVMTLACSYAKAETVAVTNVLSKIPAVKSGVIYNFGSHQTLAVNTFELASYTALSLNAGLLRTDGAAAILALDLNKVKLSFLQLPILDLTNYLSVGYGIGYQNITLTSDYSENTKDDNRFVHGLYGAVSWKF